MVKAKAKVKNTPAWKQLVFVRKLGERESQKTSVTINDYDASMSDIKQLIADKLDWRQEVFDFIVIGDPIKLTDQEYIESITLTMSRKKAVELYNVVGRFGLGSLTNEVFRALDSIFDVQDDIDDNIVVDTSVNPPTNYRRDD
jgi:hypothetical protein